MGKRNICLVEIIVLSCVAVVVDAFFEFLGGFGGVFGVEVGAGGVGGDFLGGWEVVGVAEAYGFGVVK